MNKMMNKEKELTTENLEKVVGGFLLIPNYDEGKKRTRKDTHEK